MLWLTSDCAFASQILLIGSYLHLSLQDEMLVEPRDIFPSSSASLDSNLSAGATDTTTNETASPPPSTSHQESVASAGRMRRNRIKRAKWQEKIRRKEIENKSMEIENKSTKKRDVSATRLVRRLACNQITMVSPFSISSLPKNQSGFAASLWNADKAEAACLEEDLDYFREVVRSLRPMLYK